MRPWHARSREIAALTNPAFWGLLLACAIDGYDSELHRPMPYPLAAIVLSFIGDDDIVRALPSSVRTSLHTWLASNDELRASLPARARATVPIAKEAILFMIARGHLAAQDTGLAIGPQRPRIVSARTEDSEDVRLRAQKAALVGRWFARASSIATVYRIIGVQP